MIFNLNQFVVAAAMASSAPPAELVWVERQTFLMGTVLRAEVGVAARDDGMAALEAAFAEIHRLESLMSSWDPTSEVGRLNGAPAGARVELSDDLAEILAEASAWQITTNGAFDPGIGALIDVWDLRGHGRRPSPDALRSAIAASGFERFSFEEDGRAVIKTSDASWLDTGGFGKGLALREAGRILREMRVEAAFLDFGGQILAFGAARTDGEGWRIEVADPGARERSIGWVEFGRGSIATSAQSERFVEVDGSRYGHVIDPRTGLPVPAWGSVTVVASDPVAADVLSTAIFVMGPIEGRAWAANLNDIGVLFLEAGGDGPVGSWNGAFEQFTYQSGLNQESDIDDR